MCTLRLCVDLWADDFDFIRSIMSENCVISALPAYYMASILFIKITLKIILLCKLSIRLRNIFCDVHVLTSTIYTVTRIINCTIFFCVLSSGLY